MSEYIVQSSSLKAVADKIREKTGDSAPLEFPDEFVAAIDGLSAGLTPPETPTDSILFYSRTLFSLYIANKNWGGSLYYSFDHSNWQELQNAISYEGQLNGSWYVLYVRGESNVKLSNGTNGSRWTLSGNGIKCVGNLNNLLDYSQTITSISAEAMAYLFYDCASVDFDVSLPALQIGNYAYQSLFGNCKSMVKAPDLPATSIGSSCYRDMFYGCSALTDIPDILPAMTLNTSSYDRMFGDCTLLKKCPKLPATALANSCYVSMFRGCIMLEQIPELPAITLKSNCYTSMFQDCSKIKLSETQVDEYQIAYRIPSSGTGTTATNALTNMFVGTGGTFNGAPTINTPYYTSNTIIPAS